MGEFWASIGEYLALLSPFDGGWGRVMLMGAGLTITLSLSCVVLGLPLGLALALMQRSKFALCRIIAGTFSTIFRALPELLTLFIVYHGLGLLLNKIFALFGVTIFISVNAFVAGVLALGMVLAAFSSEVWLGAFKIIDKGQYEAAHALSLSRPRTFFSVIFPQALRHALPGLSNNWLTLLKDTSLVSTISLIDIMYQSKLAAGATQKPFFFYLIACLLYMLFSAISGVGFRWLERRYSISVRRAA